MTPIADLATRLSSIREDSLDPLLSDTVRQRIFDTVGALSVGLATTEGRMLRSIDDRLRTNDEYRDWPCRCRLLVGATRATEIDDIEVRSCTTVGSVVVPVALTLAASTAIGKADNDRAIGLRLVASIITGYEAMILLGRAIDGANLIYRGIWPTYVTAAFASAATVAKYLRFDPSRFRQAVLIALQRVAPLARGALAETGYRQFALGAAVSDGRLAAYAADAGMKSSDDSFASFASAIGVGLDAESLRQHTSRPAVLDVDTKSFPSSRQATASIEAFRQLLPLKLPEVDRIDVYVPQPHRNMVDQPALPRTRIGSMIGVQYPMALSAVGSIALNDALRAGPPSNPELEAWMAKIRVHADEQLTRSFPATWGSRVEVRLASGRLHSMEVLEPNGSARKPLGWQGLQEKFERIIAAGGLSGSLPLLLELRELCQSIGDNAPPNFARILLDRAESLGSELDRAAT